MIKHHRPSKLPVEINPTEFYKELTEAALELGNLNGLQNNLPNPTILIAPLITKEATVSSKIEGTQSTVSDVFEFEATGLPKYADTKEVANYKKAMLLATNEIDNGLPITLNLIRATHQILLEGTRGEQYRGKFRENIVWVGVENATIDKADYIPPEPILVQEYMENLEKYLLENKEHPLIKIGITHYQFEAIHPFNDGNGRIGRLLIPLYLYWKKILFQPILYISGYFEKYRNEYINHLKKVDKTGKYEEWLRFFFISLKNQAKETQRLIYKILHLREQIKEKTEKMKSPYTDKVLETMFSKPIFKSKDLHIEEPTARRLLSKFVGMGILKSFAIKGVKGKIYLFPDLIDILSH